MAAGSCDMHFLARRLEAFNRDELPDWRRPQTVFRRALLLVPRLVEYLLFYGLALIALAAVIVLMAVAWLIGLDRK
ncbi:hypothetical protein [Ensifer sp. BR816]|uniref:hypothetical protein n=1 Tax=Rhizobium sp. (strain BR816) TaxID=1057002 RepID=UPI00039ED47D|nr:hypothetical protein [Ensifer sp. BR816]